MKYTVYIRTNLINGKQYVGQTKNFKRRESNWRDLSTRYANKLLTVDREKYGLENFKVEILAEVETREEAWDLEQKFTLEYNTKYPNGYNMGNGGKTQEGTLHTDESKTNMSESHIGKKLSEDTKRKMSEVHKGQTPWNKGVKNCFSDETLKKLSERMKGENHPNWGKHLSEETKKKISESEKGKTPWMKGKKHTEESKKKISNAKKGKPNISLAKKVYQYTLEGEFLASYSSTAEAARQNDFLQGEISACCNGGRYKKGKWVNCNKYKGYKWSYEPL